ncbi:MAG: hypothetical protein ACK47B_23660 [Armatimonadota bacterium]
MRVAAPTIALLLTRRGLSAWPHFRAARTEAQLAHVRMITGLHPDELSALKQLRENLDGLSDPIVPRGPHQDPDGWFQRSTGAGVNPWRVKPGILDRLLAGLTVQERAFGLLLTVLMPAESHFRNSLESTLKRRLEPDWERQRAEEDARLERQRAERERLAEAERNAVEATAAETARRRRDAAGGDERHMDERTNTATLNGQPPGSKDRVARALEQRGLDLAEPIPDQAKREIARVLGLSTSLVSAHIAKLRDERGIVVGTTRPKSEARTPAANPEPAITPESTGDAAAAEVAPEAAAAAEPEPGEFPEPQSWQHSAEVKRLQDELAALRASYDERGQALIQACDSKGQIETDLEATREQLQQLQVKYQDLLLSREELQRTILRLGQNLQKALRGEPEEEGAGFPDERIILCLKRYQQGRPAPQPPARRVSILDEMLPAPSPDWQPQQGWEALRLALDHDPAVLLLAADLGGLARRGPRL